MEFVVAAIILFCIVFLAVRFTKVSVTDSEQLAGIRRLPASQLRFSLATICDRLPPLGETAGSVSEGDYLLHEDDWRQVEFVPDRDREYFVVQVDKVHQFKADNWDGFCWKNLFVRPDNPTELALLGIKLNDLARALPGASIRNVGVYSSFADPSPVSSSRCVLDGFSIRLTPKTVIYGHHTTGVVTTLAIDAEVENESEVIAVASALTSIGQHYPLLLVDWNIDRIITLTESTEVDKWIRRNDD